MLLCFSICFLFAAADSPVAIIVAIVLVVLVLIVVAGLVVWCRYFGGKDRLDSWRKPRLVL